MTYLKLLNEHGQPKKDKSKQEKADGRGAAAETAFQGAFPRDAADAVHQGARQRLPAGR